MHKIITKLEMLQVFAIKVTYGTVHMQCHTRELEFEPLLAYFNTCAHLCRHDCSIVFRRALAFPLEHMHYYLLEHLLASMCILP